MKICVLGLGYIGLPTASILAANGHRVLGVDINPRIVDMINKGQVPIEERGLKTLFGAAVKSGNLTADDKPAAAECFLLCVPTPQKDGKADLSHLKTASESIAPYLKKNALVIVESTIPPGATEGVVIPALKASKLTPGKDLFIAHCPERVIPGAILRELVDNDRVIGGLTPACAKRAAELYKSFVNGRVIQCGLRTAEMVKLAENSFRDVNIAFANAISDICMELDLDARSVIEMANLHPRVNILNPGPGVGGHCIPVDPWFLIQSAPKQAGLLKAARKTNDMRPKRIAARIRAMMGGKQKAKAAVLGVSYKGNVDDVRESPAEKIIDELEKKNVSVCVFDPHVKHFKKDLMNLEEALSNADIAVILADHAEFKYLDPERLSGLMRRKRILDPFGIIDSRKWEEAGFQVKTL